jgi:hypothetical protein
VYLKFGEWPAFSVAHILYVLDVKLGQGTGWIGLDRIQACFWTRALLQPFLQSFRFFQSSAYSWVST